MLILATVQSLMTGFYRVRDLGSFVLVVNCVVVDCLNETKRKNCKFQFVRFETLISCECILPRPAYFCTHVICCVYVQFFSLFVFFNSFPASCFSELSEFTFQLSSIHTNAICSTSERFIHFSFFLFSIIFFFTKFYFSFCFAFVLFRVSSLVYVYVYVEE